MLIVPSEQVEPSATMLQALAGIQTSPSLEVSLQRPGPLPAGVTILPAQCQRHRLPEDPTPARGSPRPIYVQHGVT